MDGMDEALEEFGRAQAKSANILPLLLAELDGLGRAYLDPYDDLMEVIREARAVDKRRAEAQEKFLRAVGRVG